MKKQIFKNLALNKKRISNIQKIQVKGGLAGQDVVSTCVPTDCKLA